MVDITVKTNDRIFCTGKTGSGKTFLMRYLTRPVRRLIVLDPKGQINSDDWKLEPFDGNGLAKLRTGQDVRMRVRYLPGEDVEGYWLGILSDIYNASNGNVTIYIDEIYQINGGPKTVPSPVVNTLYTLGRELGIGVWGVSQRPTFIPLVQMSESDHFFVFRLNLAEDRRRMSEVSGSLNVLNQIRDPYGFYYMKPEWEEAVYTPQLKVNYTKKSKQGAQL